MGAAAAPTLAHEDKRPLSQKKRLCPRWWEDPLKKWGDTLANKKRLNQRRARLRAARLEHQYHKWRTYYLDIILRHPPFGPLTVEQIQAKKQAIPLGWEAHLKQNADYPSQVAIHHAIVNSFNQLQTSMALFHHPHAVSLRQSPSKKNQQARS